MPRHGKLRWWYVLKFGSSQAGGPTAAGGSIERASGLLSTCPKERCHTSDDRGLTLEVAGSQHCRVFLRAAIRQPLGKKLCSTVRGMQHVGLEWTGQGEHECTPGLFLAPAFPAERSHRVPGGCI